MRSLWGCHNVDWCCLDSKRASSSILLMWNIRVVEEIEECVGEFNIAYLFRNVSDHFTWPFADVYGPNADCDRRF